LRNSDLELFKRNTILNRVTPYGMELGECASFCTKLMKNHVSLLLICIGNCETRDARSQS
ncbi:MAG: hypothetical protein MR877_10615, partial [Spirochaetia bacterium]|nr:hypothetical protein [Spirochaetia bacterium]